MEEIDKFNQKLMLYQNCLEIWSKVNVIPDGLEICINAVLGQNLVLIDSIQFMNSASLQNWFKTCETKNLTICHNNFEENNYS